MILHYLENMKVKGRYAAEAAARPQPHEDTQEPRKGLVRVSSSSYIIR